MTTQSQEGSLIFVSLQPENLEDSGTVVSRPPGGALLAKGWEQWSARDYRLPVLCWEDAQHPSVGQGASVGSWGLGLRKGG